MFKRQTRGSVVCRSCGKLVGVNDDKCYNCGASNPGLWGYSKVLRNISHGLDFVTLAIGGSIILYALTLLSDISGIRMGGGLSILAPSVESLFTYGASGAVPVFQFGRWWTILSAGWLHGGLLHIAFNMLWVRREPAGHYLHGFLRGRIPAEFPGWCAAHNRSFSSSFRAVWSPCLGRQENREFSPGPPGPDVRCHTFCFRAVYARHRQLCPFWRFCRGAGGRVPPEPPEKGRAERFPVRSGLPGLDLVISCLFGPDRLGTGISATIKKTVSIIHAVFSPHFSLGYAAITDVCAAAAISCLRNAGYCFCQENKK